jgi:serine/threonine protein kinase
MEYLPLGDLENYLEAPLPESQAGVITRQILQGLVFMHENKFAHRDLKPSVGISCISLAYVMSVLTLLSRMYLSSMSDLGGGSRYQTSVSASR